MSESKLRDLSMDYSVQISFEVKEALIKSKCVDWREDFSPDEAEKPQPYFVYGKVLRQNMAENPPPRRARRFIQRFLK